MLRKNAGVTAAAVLSLSLAIGACTAAFSLIDALILRPLPVPDPGQLVYCSYPTFGLSLIENTYTNAALFDSFVQSSGGKVELFGISYPGPLQPITLDDASGEEESVRSQRISGDGFRILDIQPAIGRVLTASDRSE